MFCAKTFNSVLVYSQKMAYVIRTIWMIVIQNVSISVIGEKNGKFNSNQFERRTAEY